MRLREAVPIALLLLLLLLLLLDEDSEDADANADDASLVWALMRFAMNDDDGCGADLD